MFVNVNIIVSLRTDETHLVYAWCAACERCVAKEYVVVDHVDPLFETILAEFLADHPECTLAHDDPLAIEWRVFHASKWRVQLLCKGCHYDKTAGDLAQKGFELLS